MTYKVGDRIISKKNHACGGNEWSVARTGADIKLKCEKCGRALFMTAEEAEKMTKERKKVDDGQN